MPDKIATPRGGGKVDAGELTTRVERLELEAREYEARCRVIEGRARLEKLRAAHGGPSGKNATAKAPAG